MANEVTGAHTDISSCTTAGSDEAHFSYRLPWLAKFYYLLYYTRYCYRYHLLIFGIITVIIIIALLNHPFL